MKIEIGVVESSLKGSIELLLKREHHNKSCYLDILDELCIYLQLSNKELVHSARILTLNKQYREDMLDDSFPESGDINVLRFGWISYMISRIKIKLFRKG